MYPLLVEMAALQPDVVSTPPPLPCKPIFIFTSPSKASSLLSFLSLNFHIHSPNPFSISASFLLLNSPSFLLPNPPYLPLILQPPYSHFSHIRSPCTAFLLRSLSTVELQTISRYQWIMKLNCLDKNSASWANNKWLQHYDTVFGFRPISYFMQAFAKLNCNKYNKELGVQLKVQSFLELTATNDPVLLYYI